MVHAGLILSLIQDKIMARANNTQSCNSESIEVEEVIDRPGIWHPAKAALCPRATDNMNLTLAPGPGNPGSPEVTKGELPVLRRSLRLMNQLQLNTNSTQKATSPIYPHSCVTEKPQERMPSFYSL